MILTVTPNPALDVTYTLEHCAEGAEHRVEAPMRRAGGKGINVARVLHQQGHAVTVLAPFGGDSGSVVEAQVRASGIPLISVASDAATRSTVTVHHAAANTATSFNEFGGALTRETWDALADAVTAVSSQASVVTISGSFPPHTPQGTVARLVDAARGVPVVVDTNGAHLVEAAKAGAALLKPNQRELHEALHVADPLAGARILVAQGAGAVVVSLGAAGLMAVTKHEAVAVALPQAIVGNPTGAGDAAVAACALAISRGEDLRAMARRAAAWGAGAVAMPGAGLIDSLLAAALEPRLTLTTL